MGRVLPRIEQRGRPLNKSSGMREVIAVQKRIVRVSPIQAGKVLAVLYGIVSIPFALIMAVMSLAAKDQGPPLLFTLIIPVLYVIFGFIFTVIGAWLYNVVAKWTGGIEFETMEMPDA